MGKFVRSRTAIYLDTKFWILLRDSELGRDPDPILSELHAKLKQAASEERVICPFSADLFFEVLKQGDPETRLATASLIDELSCGVSIQSSEHRVTMEIVHLISMMRSNDPIPDVSELEFTSPINVLGFPVPQVDDWPEDYMLAVKKTFFDATWRLGFVQIAAETGPLPSHLRVDWEKRAEKLNFYNDRIPESASRSFEQIYRDEFNALLNMHLDDCAGVLLEMYKSEVGGSLNDVDGGLTRSAGQGLVNIISAAFKRNKLGNHLPTLNIQAVLAASVRWNKGRRYSSNELHDFGHAGAALATCDVMATEKSLRHLISWSSHPNWAA